MPVFMEFNKRFHEYFGDDVTPSRSPALTNMAPSLTASGGAAYEGKELNPRRSAVSGRSHRSPRIRSAGGPTVYPAEEKVQSPWGTHLGYKGPEWVDGNRGFLDGGGPGIGPGESAVGGFSGNTADVMGVPGASTSLGTAMGDQAASVIGQGMIPGALGTLGLGIALGAPADVIGPAMIGGSILGITSPIGLAALANSIGGTVAAGQIGSNAAATLGMSPTGPAAVAGAEAVNSSMGLMGMLGKGISEGFTAPAITGALSSEEAQTIGIHGSEDPVAAGAAHAMGEPGLAVAASQSMGQQSGLASISGTQADMEGINADIGMGETGCSMGSSGMAPGSSPGATGIGGPSGDGGGGGGK